MVMNTWNDLAFAVSKQSLTIYSTEQEGLAGIERYMCSGRKERKGEGEEQAEGEEERRGELFSWDREIYK